MMIPEERSIPLVSSQAPKSITLFISTAAPGDEALKRELLLNLSSLQRAGLMQIWHDGMVQFGQSRELEIRSHIQKAHLILLLLSPAFISSNLCYNQMQFALAQCAENATIIPLFLRPLHLWHEPHIEQLTPLPTNGKAVTLWRTRELAWHQVVGRLRELADRLLNQVAEYEPSYRSVASLPPLLPDNLLPRTQLREEIYQRLTHPSVTALVLSGASGLGKSVLASQLYTSAAEQLQKGHGWATAAPIWISLDGSITLADIARTLYRILERPFSHFANMSALDQASELASLLCSPGEARLLVIDQLEYWLDEHTGQPRYLEIASWLDQLNRHQTSWRVLFTSRIYPGHLSPPAHIQEFCLPAFQQKELMRDLQTNSMQIAQQELLALAQSSQADLLTLAISKGLHEKNPELSIAALLRDLSAPAPQRETMGEPVLQAIFYRHLDKEQQTLLQAFAVYREAVSLSAAAAVAEIWLSLPDRQTRLILRDLAKLHLLQSFDKLYYWPAPILADFVRRTVLASDALSKREAHIKAARYYQEQAHSVHGEHLHHLPSKDQHALVEAVWHLGQAGYLQEAYDLLCATELFADLHRWGQNSRLLELYTPFLLRPEWTTDLVQRARLANEVGEIQNALGRKKQARLFYEKAAEAYRMVNQFTGMVEALNNLGATSRSLDDAQQALRVYQEALHYCEEGTQPIVWKGVTLHNLGKVFHEQGQNEQKNRRLKEARSLYRQSLVYYRQALVWHREMGLVDEEPRTLCNMGESYAELEQPKKANRYYWQALKRFQARGDKRGEGITLNNLGNLSVSQGTHGEAAPRLDFEEKAYEYYEQALYLFREIGDRWQEGRTLRNLGRFFLTYQRLDMYERCKQCLVSFSQASAIFRDLQAPNQAEIPAWIQETILEELGPEQFAALREEIRA